MDKNRMFEGDWNPYDVLIQLSERLNRLEHAHNILAREYTKSQHDLDIALQSLNSLQRGHLALSELVAANALMNLDQK